MGDPHVEVEIKPQLKPRGSMAKEEDPKPFHQLYKLQHVGSSRPGTEHVSSALAGRFFTTEPPGKPPPTPPLPIYVNKVLTELI